MFQQSLLKRRAWLRWARGCAPAALLVVTLASLSACGSSSSRSSGSTTAPATSATTGTPGSGSTGTTGSGSTAPGASVLVAQGSVSVLTYNVAGLPQLISSSSPVQNHPQISPKLNTYELVLAQEDFAYHPLLMAQAQHPFQSVPMVVSSLTRPMNDGLNRFSQSPFTAHERVIWSVAHGLVGGSNDRLAHKGYSFARHELAPGVEVDVYNLHADAGGGSGDEDARAVQFAQLAADLNVRSAGRAVIVAGDTNLKDTRSRDVQVLADFLGVCGLRDCARQLGKPEHIDRIMIRDGGGVVLEAAQWRVADEFKDGQGQDLSDHPAIHVDLDWRLYR